MEAICVKRVHVGQGHAFLYCLSKPISFEINKQTQETHFVIISAITIPPDRELTQAFPADKDGNILSWYELENSACDTLDHEKTLNNIIKEAHTNCV